MLKRVFFSGLIAAECRQAFKETGAVFSCSSSPGASRGSFKLYNAEHFESTDLFTLLTTLRQCVSEAVCNFTEVAGMDLRV